MITVENLSLQYGGQVLFSNVDLQFTAGNCYGIIGANGAGKSTFLKILSGEIDSTSGHVYVDPKARMSVLKQNQNMYDDHTRARDGHHGQHAPLRVRQGEGRHL